MHLLLQRQQQQHRQWHPPSRIPSSSLCATYTNTSTVRAPSNNRPSKAVPATWPCCWPLLPLILCLSSCTSASFFMLRECRWNKPSDLRLPTLLVRSCSDP